MTLRRITSLLFLGLGVTIQPSLARQLPTASPMTADGQQQEALPKQGELEQKGLALLEEVITQASSLRLPENRIYLEAMAANALWKHDQARARTLFTNALNSLGQITPEENENIQGPRRGNVEASGMLRWQLLQMIARHDARLALDLLRATKSAPSANSANRDPRFENERQLEMSLATAAAGSDPQLALEIAESSLAQGYSFDAGTLLRRIREKDAAAASKLAGSILRKLRGENLGTNRQAMQFAVNLLQTSGAMPLPAFISARAVNQPAGPSPTLQTTLDEPALRELADLVAQAASNPAAGRDFLPMLQSLQPLFEKYAPARAATLKQKLGEFRGAGDSYSRNWMEFENQVQTGSLDSAITMIAKAPEEMRPNMYHRAAMQAAWQGDESRARQIAREITDPVMRRQILSEIDRQVINRSAATGKLQEARDLLNAMTASSEKVMLLTQLSHNALAKGEKKMAAELLDQARDLLPGLPAGLTQHNAQIQLGMAYAGVDPARGFEIIEPLALRLNELINAAAVLDGYSPYERSFKDEELKLTNGFISRTMFRQYVAALRQLAKADFERARNLANNFQRPEAQVMARLSLAAGVLIEQNRPNRGGMMMTEGFFVDY